jgi:hypothetical protein
MGLLFDIHVVVLVLGGILAVSALIVAQKPNARQVIEKIAPYQTTIGLVLIALGIVNFVRIVPNISGEFVKNLLVAAVMLAVCGASILLGVLFGMGPIMHFLAGNAAAEQKAHELVMKVAPYQVLIGLAGLAAAAFYFLYRFHILSVSM